MTVALTVRMEHALHRHKHLHCPKHFHVILQQQQQQQHQHHVANHNHHHHHHGDSERPCQLNDIRTNSMGQSRRAGVTCNLGLASPPEQIRCSRHHSLNGKQQLNNSHREEAAPADPNVPDPEDDDDPNVADPDDDDDPNDPDPEAHASPRLAPADECSGCLISTCAAPPSCTSPCCCAATATSRHPRKPRRPGAKGTFCLRQNYSNFRTFCKQTSLHGWQYIAQRHTAAWKHFVWFVIVLMSMGTALFFLYNNTVDFLDATVVTTVDTMTVPLTEVFFPSVVVCNINQVRRSFFDELGIYDNETFIRQIYTDYIEGQSSSTAEHLHHSYGKPTHGAATLHEKLLKEYLERMNETTEAEKSINWVTHQKCKDMFILSKWNSTTTYSFEIERDFGTDYGICCWYTPQLNFTEIEIQTKRENLTEPHWGHWFMNIEKGAKTGKDNGYTMLFDIESFDYSYYDEGSEGLKVALVHHLDMPIMRQTGFHIAPGTENQIAVTPTLISTSSIAMQRFTPEQRDCYSEEEISLKYLPRDHGYRYEMSNCLFESAFENILLTCKCFPGFHTMGGEHAMAHYDVCIGPNLTCMNDLMNRMGQFDHVEYNGQQVKCRSNCEDQVNSLFVTTSSYPNRKTLIYREEFCIITRRILQKCDGPKRKPLEREFPHICRLLEPLAQREDFCLRNNWAARRHVIPNCSRQSCPVEEQILDYARRNLVMFNIFIKDPYAKRFQKDEKITMTSYIANSGGLLGLCMGFSLISGAEILYHCVFGIVSVLCPGFRRSSREFRDGHATPPGNNFVNSATAADDASDDDDEDSPYEDSDGDDGCAAEAAALNHVCCRRPDHRCCDVASLNAVTSARPPAPRRRLTANHLPETRLLNTESIMMQQHQQSSYGNGSVKLLRGPERVI